MPFNPLQRRRGFVQAGRPLWRPVGPRFNKTPSGVPVPTQPRNFGQFNRLQPKGQRARHARIDLAFGKAVPTRPGPVTPTPPGTSTPTFGDVPPGKFPPGSRMTANTQVPTSPRPAAAAYQHANANAAFKRGKKPGLGQTPGFKAGRKQAQNLTTPELKDKVAKLTARRRELMGEWGLTDKSRKRFGRKQLSRLVGMRTQLAQDLVPPGLGKPSLPGKRVGALRKALGEDFSKYYAKNKGEKPVRGNQFRPMPRRRRRRVVGGNFTATPR